MKASLGCSRFSETSCRNLSGIAIEPAAEHAAALRPLVERCLPGVALVQCAIGDADGESQLHLLSKYQADMLLKQVPWRQRYGLARKLSYLLNMSCVGSEHPDMPLCLRQIWEEHGVDVRRFLLQDKVVIWGWRRLTEELGFHGCEV